MSINGNWQVYLYDTATTESQTGNRIVKIGITQNVRQREEHFREGNPLGRMIASGPGDMEYETDLHRDYAKQQIEREFFALSEDQIVGLEKELGTHEVEQMRTREAQQIRRNRMLLKSLRYYKEVGLRD